MKQRLKSLWQALRPQKIREVKVANGDPAALIRLLHWADAGTSLRLVLPPRLLVMESAFAYEPESHHFLHALQQGREALTEFYTRFQPADVAAMYAVPGGRTGAELPPWTIPWLETVRGFAPRGEGGLGPEHGAAVYGPVTSQKVELEMARLTGTCGSIQRHGYQPDKHGDITGFLLRRGDEFRFLVRGGKHRAAALVHLGQELVPVQFKTGWPRIIRREDAHGWPLVVEGKMDAVLAQEIFDRHFGLTLARRFEPAGD